MQVLSCYYHFFLYSPFLTNHYTSLLSLSGFSPLIISIFPLFLSYLESFFVNSSIFVPRAKWVALVEQLYYNESRMLYAEFGRNEAASMYSIGVFTNELSLQRILKLNDLLSQRSYITYLPILPRTTSVFCTRKTRENLMLCCSVALTPIMSFGNFFLRC